MVVAIHQPHYFPWLGYLAKMASVDEFIFMDNVQLEKRSYMLRNRIIDPDGQIRYLNITCEKRNHYEKEYRNIETKDFEVWTSKQKGTIIRAYKRCKYFDEIWDVISPIFNERHRLLCDVTIHSINILREIFCINTPLKLQSNINLESGLKKGSLILGICKAVGADIYFAGKGASMQYLNAQECENEGIHIVYQDYCHPIYNQIGNHPFVSGLSTLDLLFNKGIEQSKKIFWESINVQRKEKITNVG